MNSELKQIADEIESVADDVRQGSTDLAEQLDLQASRLCALAEAPRLDLTIKTNHEVLQGLDRWRSGRMEPSFPMQCAMATVLWKLLHGGVVLPVPEHCALCNSELRADNSCPKCDPDADAETGTADDRIPDSTLDAIKQHLAEVKTCELCNGRGWRWVGWPCVTGLEGVSVLPERKTCCDCNGSGRLNADNTAYEPPASQPKEPK